MSTPPAASAMVPTSCHAMVNPGTSVSISITEPITKAAMPPIPKDSETWHKRLGRHQRHAEQRQGKAGIIDRQHVKGVERQQQADAADDAGPTRPGLWNSNSNP